MKGEDGISVMMGNSPKVLLEQAVWQYGEATNIFSTFCSLFSFSPGLTFTIELLLLSSSIVILFGCGSGRFPNAATSPSRVR
jgi:hypothetical protein